MISQYISSGKVVYRFHNLFFYVLRDYIACYALYLFSWHNCVCQSIAAAIFLPMVVLFTGEMTMIGAGTHNGMSRVLRELS